jgi:hypothetical protein
MRRLTVGWVILMALGAMPPAHAHQPVMDMAPRWKRGWGIQVHRESHGSDTVKDGDSEASNPFGRNRYMDTVWVEAVYAFVPEVRVTAKAPWIDQSRVIERNGQALKQTGRGLGDIVLGLPLKHLMTGPATLSDFTLTPSLRLPTGSTSDPYPLGDGSTDVGLSFTYKRDVARFYQYYDVFYWANTRGRHGQDIPKDGDEAGFDINWGILPYHDVETNTGVWVMWDIQGRYMDRGVDADGATGGVRVSTGPIAMWYRDNMMVHMEITWPAYESFNGAQVSYGPELFLGAGITF